MTQDDKRHEHDFHLFRKKLKNAQMPDALIADFQQRYRLYRDGDDGTIDFDTLSPPQDSDIVELQALKEPSVKAAKEIFRQTVCIKLNGGLGTSMKLDRAKSLINVRHNQSFLGMIAAQLKRIHSRFDVDIPLLLMNSYRTRDDSLKELSRSGFIQKTIPLDFLQHKVPRISSDTHHPLALADEEDNWTPPGHGDLYLALYTQGLFDRLLDYGIRWAFVSNVDNLGATLTPTIPEFCAKNGVEIAMEVTPKTKADIKGGTLARHQGRLALIERAQVAPAQFSFFEDTSRFSVFNTNTLWWNVEAMRDAIQEKRLDLPMIVNSKTIAGHHCVQLESAMGAALKAFKSAKGIAVSRQRFAPVKTTADLLRVRSDAYELDSLGGLRPNQARKEDVPPLVSLDPTYYQALEDFENRFSDPLSLKDCQSFQVKGDVHFGEGVVIRGNVMIDANQHDGSKIEHCLLEG